MFLFFTPYTFLFLSFYFMFIFFMLTCSNFVVFWVFMEFLILIFIGISYTLFLNNFSSLILYFLLQTVSSFSILLFYLYPNSILFSLFICINLSIFPFHFWFLGICYRFPNFVLFLSSSFHNIPVFLIVVLFSPVYSLYFITTSLVVTVLLSGFIILSTLDFRAVIVSSSVGNNSWFFLSALLDFTLFLLFFMMYSLFLYLVFCELNVFTNVTISQVLKSSNNFIYYIVFLSGLPPFPVFFIKILVLFSYILKYGPSLFLLMFIISSSLMLVGYLYSLSNYLTHVFSSQSNYLI